MPIRNTRDYPGKKHRIEGLKNRVKFVLTEEDVKLIYETCNSITDACHQINRSRANLVKWLGLYKEPESGKTYLELFEERPTSRAPNRYKGGLVGRDKLERILKGEQTNTLKSLDVLKYGLLSYGFFREQCSNCDFQGRRISDHRSPLLVTFKDGNEKNGKQSNIELLCYNCAFRSCSSDKEFISIVQKSMESIDATKSLSDIYISDTKEKIIQVDSISEEDIDEETIQFLKNSGFNF